MKLNQNIRHRTAFLILFVVAIQSLVVPVNACTMVTNNTDLGINGLNTRTHDTTYYSNDSQIDMHLIFHALGTGASQTFDSNVSINGTIVSDKDFRTSAGAGFHDHWSYDITIPRGASYNVTNSTNAYSLEWREYECKNSVPVTPGIGTTEILFILLLITLYTVRKRTVMKQNNNKKGE